jgi:inhibitor of cysteine peptidase
MFKYVGSAVALVALASLGACSSSSSDGGTESDQAVSGVRPGEEGGLCGGFAGIACKDGLECKYVSPKNDDPQSGPPPGALGMPAFPDQSGTCVKKSSGPPPGSMGMPLPDSVEVAVEDDGQTIPAKVGQKVVLELDANPTTGFDWIIVRTDRSFGYGEKSFAAAEPGVGSGGTTTITWQTVNPIESLVGKHTVNLEYKRSWETTTPPAKTFSFTVDVYE